MSSTPWLIQYQSGSYCFGRPRVDRALADTPATTPTDPKPLVAAMTAGGYRGEPTMLAVPSEWCLSGSMVLASRRMTRNRQAVAYAIEEHLPLSAEEMVCDFATHDTDVFGVAAETSLLLPIVRSLEDAGVAIATITPAALLLLERLVPPRSLRDNGLVLLANGNSCDMFLCVTSLPRQWCCLPLDAEVLTREVAAILLMGAESDDSVLPVTTANLAGPITEALADLEPDIELISRQMDNDTALLAEAANVLSTGKRLLIELRRDQIGQYDAYGLMRGAVGLFLVAVVVTLGSLAAVAWTRGNRYQAATDLADRCKRAVFGDLFPAARVPTGVCSRLQSERRKLLGVSAGTEQTPELKFVTRFLVNTLDALPTDLRFRLVEMRFESDNAYLEGEVRRHGDVDIIASSLRTRGFTVDPPRTEQLASKGVSFSLNVSLSSADDKPH